MKVSEWLRLHTRAAQVLKDIAAEAPSTTYGTGSEQYKVQVGANGDLYIAPVNYSSVRYATWTIPAKEVVHLGQFMVDHWKED